MNSTELLALVPRLSAPGLTPLLTELVKPRASEDKKFIPLREGSPDTLGLAQPEKPRQIGTGYPVGGAGPPSILVWGDL